MKTKKNTRIFSVLLAICMLVSLLPAGMLSASAVALDQEYLFMVPGGTTTLTADENVVWESSDEDVVTVANGVVTAVKAGTAVITATGAETAATAYVVVDANPHYYYNLAKAFNGTKDHVPFADMGYAQTTKGSPDEVLVGGGYGRYVETDPWRAGTVSGDAAVTTDWFYTGSIADTNTFRGYRFLATAGYASVIVNVPAPGTYDVKIHHSKYGKDLTASMKYAKVGTEFENATELGELDIQQSVNTQVVPGFSTTFERVTVEEAGEYEFFIIPPTSSGAAINAIELINVDEPRVEFKHSKVTAVYGEEVDLAVNVTEGYTPVVTVYDSNIATAVGGTTVRCGTKTGSTVITVSTEEYPELSDSIVLEVGSKASFNYIKSVLLLDPNADAAKKISTAVNDTALMKSYDDKAVEDDGWYPSYGWMAPEGSAWAMNPSTKSLGVYMNPSLGQYTTMVIDVPVDGRYQIYSDHSLWHSTGAAFDLYLAPTADAANIISDQYKLNSTPFDVTEVDGKDVPTHSEYAGAMTLEEGSYTVAYKITKAGGFFIRGLTLQNVLGVSEVDATALNLTAASTFINKGSTTYLTAAVEPIEAKAWVTYESSDDTIATVDGNGVVTGVSAGTATITATAGDLTATVDITVCDKVYDYAFKALGAAYSAANSNATTYFTQTPFTDLTWYETYGDYSSPWFFKTTNVLSNGSINKTAIQYIPSAAQFGAFVDISTSDKYMTFQVHLEEGVYSTELVQYMNTPETDTTKARGGSIDVDFYVVPTSANSYYGDDYKVMNVVSHDYGGARTDRAEKTIALAKGDYYITLKNAGTNHGRYSYLHNIRLYRVGDVKVESFDLAAASDMVEVNATTTVSATNMVPSFKTLDGAVWTSSDDTIATVANGVVTGVSAGTVTITAEIDGVRASVDVTVTDKVYDYAFHALSAALKAEGNTSNVSFASDTYKTEGWYENYREITSPWLYDSASSNYFMSDPSGKYGSFALNSNAGSFVTIKVTLEEGEYLSELVQYMAVNTTDAKNGSADVNFYVAPANASNKKDASYKMMTVAAHDSGVQTDRATETVKVAAGDYLITLENAGRGRYTYLHNIRLYRVGDVKVESFDLAAASDMVEVNATTTVSATNMVPSIETLEGATWTSSDNTIATVVNGVVTGVAPGTVTITAEKDGVSRSVDITVYKLLEYEFYEVGKNYDANGDGTPDGTTNFKSVPEFAADYEASQSTSAPFAPWMYVSANQNFFSADTYGTFMFGNQDGTIDSVVLKIKVDADGEYRPAATRHIYGSSTPATVHIAPDTDEANKTADKYYVCTISDEGANGTTAEEMADSSVMLREGEYYLTFQHAVPSTEADRYVCLFDFKLYNVGKYDIVQAESVSVSADMPAIVIGETTTMSYAVLPTQTENKTLSWKSSNDAIATVDANGIVTGRGNGVVTITGTTTDGTNLSASADIVVGGTYTYDFVKSITGQQDYVAGTNYEVKNSNLSVGYQASIDADSAPWYVDGRSDAVITYKSDTAAHGAFFFGTMRGLGYLRLKIKVEESGVYTGALRYSDYDGTAPTTVYLAPVENGTENITTTANLIFDIQPSYGALHQEAAITDDLYLNAGEYYLYFKQNGDPETTLEHRYLTTHYFSLAKTEDLGIVTLTNGAQMRTTDPQGLRFIASIDKTHADFANVSEYGIVLLPAEDIAEGDELTVDYKAANGHKVAVVKAENLYSTTDNKNIFTAVLINIPDASLNRKIAARAYAVVNDEYVYSDLTVERSIYEIALAITQNENATEADKTAAQKVVDKVNPPAAQ